MPHIDSTEFGSITIDGKRYEHDIVLTSEGKLREGRTEARHLIGRKEFFDLLFERPGVIIIGTGQGGALEVAKEVREFASKEGVELIVLPTPQAIQKFNELCKQGRKVAAYIHVTC